MNDLINVLIVDDNSVNRIAAKSQLLSFQVNVLEADSGECAIQIVKNEKIDIIFMDILMPEMDGIQTTRYIRMLDKENRIKIIATSGTEIQNQEQYLKINKFDSILLKPLKISEILECLSQWFDLAYDTVKMETARKEMCTYGILSKFFGRIQDLDLQEGLKYAHHSQECYLRVMKTSLRQLNDTIHRLHDLLKIKNNKQIYLQLHSIKSVFFYLGAQDLGKKTNDFETIFMQRNENNSNNSIYIKSMQDFQLFIQRITIFHNELEQAIQAYDSSINKEQNETNETGGSIDEINQLIEMITLHVYRFEYVEIMNGLKSLEQIVNEKGRYYVSEAIAATEDFNYDKVKAMLVGCWNEVNDQ